MKSSSPIPAWWRWTLVAVATAIFCSCSATPAVKAQEVTESPFQEDGPGAGQSESSVVISDESADPSGAPPVVVMENGPTIVSDEPAEPALSSDRAFICDTGSDCHSLDALLCDPDGRVIGPSDEYICDGGDYYSPVGVRADWSIDGLEQEDAVAHYDTPDGRVVVVPSNRVCIYAPRFAAVRRVVRLMAHEQPQFVSLMVDEQLPAKAREAQPVASSLQRRAVVTNRTNRPPILFRQRQQAAEFVQLVGSMDAFLSIAPYANLHLVRTGQVVGTEKAEIRRAALAAIVWTGVQAPQVVLDARRAEEIDGLQQAGIVYQTDEPNRSRLRLVKLASCNHALPGEEVEFTLRFDNVGDTQIGNVTIVDNLSTRLEYVPDSAQSSVDAQFIIAPNDTHSVILRWEIQAPLKPRSGGVLRFRAQVR